MLAAKIIIFYLILDVLPCWNKIVSDPSSRCRWTAGGPY